VGGHLDGPGVLWGGGEIPPPAREGGGELRAEAEERRGVEIEGRQ